MLRVRLKNSNSLLLCLLMHQCACAEQMRVDWRQEQPAVTLDAAVALCEARGAALCLPRSPADNALLTPGTWIGALATPAGAVSLRTRAPLRFAMPLAAAEGPLVAGPANWTTAGAGATACCAPEVVVRVRWRASDPAPALPALSPPEPSVQALPCQAGYACPGREAPPAPCANGTHSAAPAAATCDACPAGTFSTARSKTCTPCEAGTYAAASRSGACTPCEPGSYAAARDAPCPTCPAGAYCPSPAQASATCPAHTATPRPGMQSKLDCACAEGYACTYVRRIMVTLSLTAAVDHDRLIAALAFAAGVPAHKVSVVAQGQRRLLSAQVVAFLEGVDAMRGAPLGLPIEAFAWEPSHWVLARPPVRVSLSLSPTRFAKP